MFKPIKLAAALSVAPLIFANTANAAEFVPQVGLGINHLEFVTRSGDEYISDYGTLNVNLTGVFGRVYTSFNTELFGADSSYERSSDIFLHMQRTDYSLAVGVVPVKGLNIFGGYAVNKTGFVREGGGNSFVHKDRGFYGGLGYSFVVGTSGSLAINAAYADFDGEIRAGDGSSTGLSYGVSWTAALNERYDYVIALKAKNYLFELDNSADEVDKDIIMLSLGLVFR